MPRSHSITCVLPVLRMYSAASRNSSIVADGPRLSSTGMPDLADRFQQRIVLHVAGADLQHVGIVGHQRDVLRGHHLGDDGQAGLLAGLGQQLQPLFLQPLEAVGAGARLERAAAQAGRAGFLDDVGDFEDLLRLSTEQGPAMTPMLAAADLAGRGPRRRSAPS